MPPSVQYSFVLAAASMRHPAAPCKILLFIAICLAAACCGQLTEDAESPDYSAIFQQFLLQKIRDGEAWSSYDYEAQFPQRGRQEDINEDSNNITAIIDEYDEISSEDSDEEEQEEEAERVINTAPYQMTSVSGGLSADINLQQMSGSDLLTLEARITISEAEERGESLFSNKECVPEVYLVSGHSDCRNLPEVKTEFEEECSTNSYLHRAEIYSNSNSI